MADLKQEVQGALKKDHIARFQTVVARDPHLDESNVALNTCYQDEDPNDQYSIPNETSFMDIDNLVMEPANRHEESMILDGSLSDDETTQEWTATRVTSPNTMYEDTMIVGSQHYQRADPPEPEDVTHPETFTVDDQPQADTPQRPFEHAMDTESDQLLLVANLLTIDAPTPQLLLNVPPHSDNVIAGIATASEDEGNYIEEALPPRRQSAKRPQPNGPLAVDIHQPKKKKRKLSKRERSEHCSWTVPRRLREATSGAPEAKRRSPRH